MVASIAYLSLYDSATPTGRARLLDGSARPGPHAWLRRVPAPAPPGAMRSPFFAFLRPSDFPVALALDLLLLPPLKGPPGGLPRCTPCHTADRDASLGPDGRHFVPCPHGIRLSPCCHHPTRDVLAELCRHTLGTSRVIAEGPRPGEGPQGGGPMAAFMARAGASLPKQPDLVLEGVLAVVANDGLLLI